MKPQPIENAFIQTLLYGTKITALERTILVLKAFPVRMSIFLFLTLSIILYILLVYEIKAFQGLWNMVK